MKTSISAEYIPSGNRWFVTSAVRRKVRLRERSTSGGLALASRDWLKAVASVTLSHYMMTFSHLIEVMDDTVERRVRPRRPELLDLKSPMWSSIARAKCVQYCMGIDDGKTVVAVRKSSDGSFPLGV